MATTLQNLLCDAIESGDLHTTRELLEQGKGIDVNNTRDWWGWTPLHVACRYGRLQIARYLILEKNANVNALACTFWSTPLYLACQNDEHAEIAADIAELLWANGASVNTKGRYGLSLFHRVCCSRSTRNGSKMRLIRVLLNHGADINAKDYNGETAIFNAWSYQPDIDVIKLLLANGADRYVQNHSGRGPIDVLKECSHKLLFESYDLWPLAVSGIDKHAPYGTTQRKYVSGSEVVRLNPDLSQHQRALGLKALLLVRQLPVHEVSYEILGFLTPASVEKTFLLTV